jgi:hypothetical protein
MSRPDFKNAITIERTIPSSELLLSMASVAHAGNLGPGHYFPQLTPYLQATWPEHGWPAEEMAETQVMRILLARELALEVGD